MEQPFRCPVIGDILHSVGRQRPAIAARVRAAPLGCRCLVGSSAMQRTRHSSYAAALHHYSLFMFRFPFLMKVAIGYILFYGRFQFISTLIYHTIRYYDIHIVRMAELIIPFQFIFTFIYHTIRYYDIHIVRRAELTILFL